MEACAFTIAGDRSRIAISGPLIGATRHHVPSNEPKYCSSVVCSVAMVVACRPPLSVLRLGAGWSKG